MSEHSRGDIERVAAQFYEGVLGGDWDKVAASVQPDFIVAEAAGLPFGGDYKGVEGLQQMFADLVTNYFEDAAFELQAVFATDTQSVAHFRFTGKVRQSGVPFETEIIELADYQDGKISLVKPFYYDTKTLNNLLTNQ